jgi:HEAT repeat protein
MRDLRKNRHSCHSWYTLLTAGSLLLCSSAALAQRNALDRVDELRLALKIPVLGLPPENAGELALRRQTLTKKVQALRTLSELRRALLLQEWSDIGGKGVDRALTRPVESVEVSNIDREIRQLVAERFEKGIRAVLQQGDDTARMAAATMLGEMGTSVRAAATRTSLARGLGVELARLTADESPGVREAAARALGTINPDPKVAVPALSKLLADDNVALRRAAAGALASMVQRVNQISSEKGATVASVEASRPEIIRMVQEVLPAAAKGSADTDAEVRRLSAEALYQGSLALDDLAPNPSHGTILAPEIGKLVPGDKTGAAVIDAALPVPEPAGPAQVTEVVQGFNAQIAALKAALADPDPRVRRLACRTLENMADARLRMLKAQAGAPPEKGAGAKPPARLEDLLLRGLQAMLSELAACLDDPVVAVRLAALDALELLESATAPASPAVIKALGDRDHFVRWSAARVLGKTGKAGVDIEAAVPALARLMTDSDTDVRLMSAATLERYGPDAAAAVPALIAATGQGDAEIRIAAMHALHGIGKNAEKVVPALIDALGNPEYRVRQTAAEILGFFGPEARSAEPALRRALDDSNADVRKAASDALVDILAAPAPPKEK